MKKYKLVIFYSQNFWQSLQKQESFFKSIGVSYKWVNDHSYTVFWTGYLSPGKDRKCHEWELVCSDLQLSKILLMHEARILKVKE